VNKIKTISHWFRILFQIIFVLDIVMLIAFWMNGAHPPAFFGPIQASFLPSNINIPIPSSMDLTTKLLGLLISCIPTGITLAIYYCLIKLFSLYERAEIFTTSNVMYFKKIGYLLLASALIQPFYEALISFTLAFNAAHGHRIATASFGTNNFSEIIIALIIILVSWIMTEGCKLRDEQAYIV